MPHINSSENQVKRNGQMSRKDIKNVSAEDARSKIQNAYSGNENKGPAREPKIEHPKDRTKSRRLSEDSDKTPIR